MFLLYIYTILGFGISFCQSGFIDCGNDVNVIVTTEIQNLTTPRYPNNYPRPVSCSWKLTSKNPSSCIFFRVVEFSVTKSIFCVFDSFKIKDGPSRLSPHIFTWCGDKQKGTVFKTTQDQAVVYFSAADRGKLNQGFHIQFWALETHKVVDRDAEFSIGHYTLIVVFVFISSCLFVFIVCLTISRCLYHRRRNNRISSYPTKRTDTKQNVLHNVFKVDVNKVVTRNTARSILENNTSIFYITFSDFGQDTDDLV